MKVIRLGWRWLGLSAVTLFIGACTTGPGQKTADIQWDQHSARLLAATHWRVRGKVALRTPEQSETASLDWQQRGDQSELRLSGPLGLAPVSAVSDGRTLTVSRGDDQREMQLDSMTSITAATGWPLPLQQLPFWLRGLPAPGDQAATEIEGGLLRRLQQDGWQVEYQDYGSFEGDQLPTRIAVANGQLSARLLLREWQLAQ
ncbi:MAG: lipoprotein insertase outer membrane protein LolB [Pseudomonadota bacterium]